MSESRIFVSNPWKDPRYDAPVNHYGVPKRAGGRREHEVAVPVADEGPGLRHDVPLAPLGGILDTIDQGIVLLQSDAYPCYRNSAAERLLDADAAHGNLAREIRSVSRAALEQADRRSAEVDVETPTGRYRMRATLLLQKIKEIRSRAVLVTIEKSRVELPSRDALMKRFGLTGREADVALRLAMGQRNAMIANEMRISTHTARHHTENVLAKLGVHTRAQVSRAIVEGQASGFSDEL